LKLSVHFHLIKVSCTMPSSASNNPAPSANASVVITNAAAFAFTPPPHLSEWKMWTKVFKVEENGATHFILEHYSSELSTQLFLVEENGTTNVIRPPKRSLPLEPLPITTNGAPRRAPRAQPSGSNRGAPLRAPRAHSVKRKDRKDVELDAAVEAKIDARAKKN
jgi:hypothetical protein